MRATISKWALSIAAGAVFGLGVWMSAPAKEPATATLGWVPSVYYAESTANCTIDKAWKLMLDYQVWNPTFVGSNVTPVRGKYRAEGEVVLIKKQLKNATGETLPEFFAETVKVVPQRHIVWYVYMKEGDPVRNFVDFGLTEGPAGVKFNIYYYAQNRLSADLLAKERTGSQASLDRTVVAFKKHCEAAS